MATKLPWPATPADVANLPRNAVHDMIELLIHRLDLEDGDSDFEETDAEDSFALSWYASGQPGAGCPVSEPDHCSAGDDRGSELGSYDGGAGDPEDAEDGGDTELNGDEGDHSLGAPWE